jgi:REP-associated tyrosine transposase
MPRLARVVATGVAHHVTQRGNARRVVFDTDSDRFVYLSLLRDAVRRHHLTVVGYCLMSNHVHLIVIPQAPDSMPVALREIHGRYAAYLNSRQTTTGHVWQGRYYSCPMDEPHLWAALRYVERNPVRAGMLGIAELYPWSSARVHCEEGPTDGIVDLSEWQCRWGPQAWREFLGYSPSDGPDAAMLRRSTHSGRPLGSEDFVRHVERETGRTLAPRKGGRPRKAAAQAALADQERLEQVPKERGDRKTR